MRGLPLHIIKKEKERKQQKEYRENRIPLYPPEVEQMPYRRNDEKEKKNVNERKVIVINLV
jgi:hypothetical protein